MPVIWEEKGYQFYFRTNEPLKKHKPAHIHVRGAKRGKIQFWLEETDTKSKDEDNLTKGSPRVLINSVIKVKKIKGRVSEEEQNEIEKIVKKNRSKFLKEWNRRKEKWLN